MIVHYNLAAALISNLAGILVLVSILLNSHLLRESKSKASSRWMAFMIAVCLIGCVSEIIFEIIDGRIFPFAREINLAVKTTNHLESIFAGFIFIGFIRSILLAEEKWPKPLKFTAIIVCTLGSALLISNLFTGLAFTVDDANVYARGPLGQLGLIVSLATLLYLVIILIIENKRNNTYLHFPVLLCILPFIVGGGLQMLVPSLRLSNMAYALGIVTTHLSMQKTLLHTDGMTGVYNRTFIDYYIRKSLRKGGKKTISGLLVDINSFKEINDTYGHTVGDEAIKNTANILKKVSGSEYIITRYGGDEFILIKENSDVNSLLSLKARIRAATDEFNRTSGAPYNLSFSIGTAVLESKEGGFNGLLEKMDKSLYQDKKEYYENSGKERRR